LSNLLKRAKPIERNWINDNSIIEAIKNSVNDKLAKVKKKSAKAKNKSVIENEENKSTIIKAKSAMKKVKNLTINERDTHGVGYT